MTYFDLINKTITSITNHISIMSIKNYPPDILIEISRELCGTFDFFKAEELVEIQLNKHNMLFWAMWFSPAYQSYFSPLFPLIHSWHFRYSDLIPEIFQVCFTQAIISAASTPRELRIL